MGVQVSLDQVEISVDDSPQGDRGTKRRDRGSRRDRNDQRDPEKRAPAVPKMSKAEFQALLRGQHSLAAPSSVPPPSASQDEPKKKRSTWGALFS